MLGLGSKGAAVMGDKLENSAASVSEGSLLGQLCTWANFPRAQSKLFQTQVGCI